MHHSSAAFFRQEESCGSYIPNPFHSLDKLYDTKPHHNEQEEQTDPDTVDTQAQLDVADVKSNNFGAI